MGLFYLAQNDFQVTLFMEAELFESNTKALSGQTLWGDQGAEAAWRSFGVAVVELSELEKDDRIAAVTEGDPLLAAAVDALNSRANRGLKRKFQLLRKRLRNASTTPSAPIESWLEREEEAGIHPEGAERMLAFRNAHAGENAIIIGNGPSLNVTPIESLGSLPTFGVNSIFLARRRLPKPLDYYVVEDSKVMEENVDQISMVDAGHRLFPQTYESTLNLSKKWSYRPTDVFFRLNTGFYGRGTPAFSWPRFSHDLSRRIYAAQSVTLINLQLAFWMGFKKVGLVGMDFSYSVPSSAEVRGNHIVSRGPDPNHFDPDYFGPGKTWKDPKLDRVEIAYRHFKNIYALYGREIVNCSVGGQLEVFRRQKLEEFLNEA